MGPGQFSTQCVEFLAVRILLWKGKIKLPKIPQVALGKALPEFLSQTDGQVLDQCGSILRPFLSLLFLLDDHPSNIPVSLDHGKVDSPVSLGAGGAKDFRDGLVKISTLSYRLITPLQGAGAVVFPLVAGVFLFICLSSLVMTFNA